VATSKGQTATAKKTETEADAKASASYAATAMALGGDARALADSIREDLAKLRARCADDFTGVAPAINDAATTHAISRIPAAVDDVLRTLEGLIAAAADLTREATR
jgi:hypothetical protein